MLSTSRKAQYFDYHVGCNGIQIPLIRLYNPFLSELNFVKISCIPKTRMWALRIYYHYINANCPGQKLSYNDLFEYCRKNINSMILMNSYNCNIENNITPQNDVQNNLFGKYELEYQRTKKALKLFKQTFFDKALNLFKSLHLKEARNINKSYSNIYSIFTSKNTDSCLLKRHIFDRYNEIRSDNYYHDKFEEFDKYLEICFILILIHDLFEDYLDAIQYSINLIIDNTNLDKIMKINNAPYRFENDIFRFDLKRTIFAAGNDTFRNNVCIKTINKDKKDNPCKLSYTNKCKNNKPGCFCKPYNRYDIVFDNCRF